MFQIGGVLEITTDLFLEESTGAVYIGETGNSIETHNSEEQRCLRN